MARPPPKQIILGSINDVRLEKMRYSSDCLRGPKANIESIMAFIKV